MHFLEWEALHLIFHFLTRNMDNNCNCKLIKSTLCVLKKLSQTEIPPVGEVPRKVQLNGQDMERYDKGERPNNQISMIQPSYNALITYLIMLLSTSMLA